MSPPKKRTRERIHKKTTRAQCKPALLPTKQDRYFKKRDLDRGIKVELEHTQDPKIAKKIAKHHLQENPLYYDPKIGLSTWEKGLEKEYLKRKTTKKKSTAPRSRKSTQKKR